MHILFSICQIRSKVVPVGLATRHTHGMLVTSAVLVPCTALWVSSTSCDLGRSQWHRLTPSGVQASRQAKSSLSLDKSVSTRLRLTTAGPDASAAAPAAGPMEPSRTDCDAPRCEEAPRLPSPADALRPAPLPSPPACQQGVQICRRSTARQC